MAEGLLAMGKSVLKKLIERAVLDDTKGVVEFCFPDPTELKRDLDNELAMRGFGR